MSARWAISRPVAKKPILTGSMGRMVAKREKIAVQDPFPVMFRHYGIGWNVVEGLGIF